MNIVKLSDGSRINLDNVATVSAPDGDGMVTVSFLTFQNGCRVPEKEIEKALSDKNTLVDAIEKLSRQIFEHKELLRARLR